MKEDTKKVYLKYWGWPMDAVLYDHNKFSHQYLVKAEEQAHEK